MQGFEHGRGRPIHMSVTEVACHLPCWVQCPQSAAIQTKPKEHICQGIEGAFFFRPSKPLNRCAQMPLAGQVKVLIFLLGSGISECCKNFYYLEGAFENASHFPSLSPQRIWNIYFSTTDAWSTGFTSSKLWLGKLRFSLGLSISRGKVHPLIKGEYRYVYRIAHTQIVL